MGNKGDLAERSRVDDVDGFLKILVRCTEYELVNKRNVKLNCDYSQKRAEVTTKLSKDKIEEAMRDSDELKCNHLIYTIIVKDENLVVIMIYP